MSLRERQPYMEESERLKLLHARQYPTYKVFSFNTRKTIIILHFSINLENETRQLHPQIHLLLQHQHHHHHPQQQQQQPSQHYHQIFFQQYQQQQQQLLLKNNLKHLRHHSLNLRQHRIPTILFHC